MVHVENRHFQMFHNFIIEMTYLNRFMFVFILLADSSNKEKQWGGLHLLLCIPTEVKIYQGPNSHTLYVPDGIHLRWLAWIFSTSKVDYTGPQGHQSCNKCYHTNILHFFVSFLSFLSSCITKGAGGAHNLQIIS